jgi:Protein of unknown function (DUF2508).
MAFEPDGYAADVRRAYSDWQAAENYFDNVADPDLIDYAIYDMEAAKKKYVYMLKKARERYGEEDE